MRVGVIGLGIMGAPFARNLLRAGHALTVHTRTRARAAELLAGGAAWADSPAAVAAAVDAVVTMLPDTPDVEAVIAGPGGVLAGAHAGLLAIDMSTIDPAAARALAERAAAAEVALLDAPVSGGEQGAIAGTLSIMVGGDAAAFERAAPLFAALGKRITHMGGPGQGQMTKLVNQVIGAGTLAAVAEGVLLAAEAGLDPAAMVTALGGGAAASWMLAEQAPRMQRRDFAPGFMVRLQQKDLRLALASAERLGVQLPLTAIAQLLFSAVEARGGGELGTQAIVMALEALAKRSS
ncbi:MAG TPA: NAD(P)-dependent oxidoreductase [Candidatus Binatus sp.]|nr:NAD(P)-dependent oxidoreductase [Candidatus Binatus sp.]